MTRLHADFSQGLGVHWRVHEQGGSRLELTGSSLRLINADAAATRYSNAQIDDYQGLPRRAFLWSPPLTLTVRARFSHPGASLTGLHHRTPPACHPEGVMRPNPTAERPLSSAHTTFEEPSSVKNLDACGEAGSFTGDAEQCGLGAGRVQDDNGEKRAAAGIWGSGVLLGTAGFGFWNDPFMLTEKRLPALPRAIWFFYASPPSDMKLDLNTPGWGWKAAAIDAARLPFLLLAPTIPVAVPLMRVAAAYRRLWPIGQRAIGVGEAPVDVQMTEWHTYGIQWGRRQARFLVDGRVILDYAPSPQGPLGLVIWIDNQYMVVTPQGRLRHGLLDKPGEQGLELAAVTIE